MRISQISFLLLLLLGMWMPTAQAQSGCYVYMNATPSSPNFKKVTFEGQAYGSTGGTNAFKYSWDFGDGSTGTGVMPTHTYAQAGFYPVCVTATDTISGCFATDCRYIVTANHSQCTSTLTYTAQPQGVVNFATSLAGVSYLWDFGDGGLYGTTATPAHTYVQNGQYHVTAYIVDATGCIATASQLVTVTTALGGWYNCITQVDTTSSNGGFTYQFDVTHFGNMGLSSAYMFYGDGTTDMNVASSYTHTYSKAGQYYVSFSGADSSGCHSSWGATINVGTFCYANPYVQTGHWGNPKTVAFSAWVLSNSANQKYYWNFGDGSGDSSLSPMHTYANYGSYQACLHMEATDGSCSMDTCITVMVYNTSGNCTTDFTADTLSNGAVSFTPIAGALNALWSFGDGVSSAQTAPTHTYAKNGQYNVWLQTIDNTGCLASIGKSVFVSNAAGGWNAPVAFISYQDSGVNTIAFTSQVFGLSGPVTYMWSFGDGTTDTTANPLHTFAQPGVYQVFLQVMDSNYNYAYQYVTVYVGKFVTGYFSAHPQGTTTVALSGYASGMPNGAFTYAWDFGDGVQQANTQPFLYHTYPAYGIYNVCLTVNDTVNNVSDTTCLPVVINNHQLGCTVNFTAQDLGNGTFQFADSLSSSTFVAWAWDFGDGTPAVVGTSTPQHTYANKGQYTVVVTAVAANGCMTYAFKTILVTSAAGGWINCVVDVAVSAPTGSNTVSFTTTLYGGSSNTKYFWSFGDNTIDTVMNPVHTYPAAGAYHASLSISDSLCYAYWNGQVNVSGVSNQTLSGKITLGNGITPAISAQVYLVTSFWGGGIMAITDSTFTDTLGNYSFTNVPNGYQFTLKAQLPQGHPDEANYLPTYLGNTLVWSASQMLYGAGTIANANIDMIAVNSLLNKSAKISGKLVSASGNYASIVNVPVIVFDDKKNPVAYTYSAADGSFEFANLGYGIYHVHPEMMNKATTQANVWLSSAKPEELNLMMSVHDQTIEPMSTSSVDGVALSEVSLYPNPATDFALLTLEMAATADLKVEVLDLMGRTQFTVAQTAQTAAIELPVSQLAQGVYMVRISANGAVVATQRLVKE